MSRVDAPSPAATAPTVDPGGRPLRVLLLVPSMAKTGIEQDVAGDRHPTMDYHALAAALGGDIADYRAVLDDRSPVVAAARRAGLDLGLAALAFRARRRYDVIYSNGENVSIPLAALFRMGGRRPGHILIGHRLSAPKKRALLRALHGQMDAVLVYSETQYRYALNALRFPRAKLHQIPFHADHRFFRPIPAPVENVICSAGLEWRDYPTLIGAVAGLDVRVCLAAASPWSRHRDETGRVSLPTNVEVRRYGYAELRDLYARARLVVVPLLETDFQAGITTLLESMAMGKAVIVTRITGQRDVVVNGQNGLYVPPGDVPALRGAIERLLADPGQAARLGAAARSAVEQRMTLEHWVERIASVARALGAATPHR